MPSAANIKVDKQITSETASVESASNQQNTPIKQAIVIIEHKIRNLEKRKAKLESYRDLQSSGKDLNQDQRVAVAKYDEVVQTLEFARDLCKQFQGIAVVADKDLKKVARKEAQARSQQEIAKVREILLVQDALQQLGQENVREDFLLGRNGAVTLAETDLKVLDDIYPEVSPKHEAGSPANFTTQVQTAAEHLLAIVEGKPKEVVGTTYQHIKEVIGKVHESGYFDQSLTDNNVAEYTEEIQETIIIEQQEATLEPLPEMPMENSIPIYHVEQPIVQEEVAVVAVAPVIEQPFYQQQPPAPRPISEVLGTGTFFFLQDSELDSPEQTPQNPVITNATIPSQTFTNQNFVSMTENVVPLQNPIAGFVAPPNPPPPIPMPPSHLPGMEFPPVAQMANSPMATYAAYQQSPVPEDIQVVHQQAQQHQPHHLSETRNGGDDIQKQGHDDNLSGNSPKNGPRSRNLNQRRNGPSSGHGRPQHDSGYHQGYYQHNNGYANRQRPGRGGNSGGGAPRGNRPAMHNKSKPAQQQH